MNVEDAPVRSAKQKRAHENKKTEPPRRPKRETRTRAQGDEMNYSRDFDSEVLKTMRRGERGDREKMITSTYIGQVDSHVSAQRYFEIR